MSESDEIIPTTNTTTAGERLRAAREKKKLSLEDVANQTRIPLRHLQSLEEGDWSRLPAPTYTIGFAKSYASAVGLDRNEIADDLRADMGGFRPDSTGSEVFEPVDPARTMPKWLVLGAIGAIILVVVFLSWMNNRALQPDAPAQEETAAASPDAAQPAAPMQQPQQPAAAASGPVVLTAVAPAWLRVTDQGKTIYETVLQPGQRYEVPSTAVAPLLRVGAPEALRVTVGNATAPPVGPAGQVTSNVSLKGEDLMRGGAAATTPPPSAPPGVQNTAG